MKTTDIDYAARDGLEEAEAFSALLGDLFTGAGHGGDLTFTAEGLDGLTRLLRTIQDHCETARQTMVPSIALAPMTERRVN